MASMAARNLRVGRLEEMSIRAVWPMEERSLTPWLAENLDVLEKELGFGLELVSREHRVGRDELDLLLRADDGRTVIVENQFGRSDHGHLGQLLAYAAGTDAEVVVWIAEAFTEEHLAALEWLNASTTEDVAFFAVTLAAVRIGDSIPAPFLTTVARPNQWVKQTAHERKQVQHESRDWDWDAYLQEMRLPPARVETGKRLIAAVETEVRNRGLSWSKVFRKGYVAFQRQGGYNVVAVDLYWNRPPRLWVKIPAAPAELNLASPYPALEEIWLEREREWGWIVPSPEAAPDVGPLLDLIAKYHPATGPMSALAVGT